MGLDNPLIPVLQRFAPVLGAFGLPLREPPSLPDGSDAKPYPPADLTLFIAVPPGQEAALLEADGSDPTMGQPVEPTAAARRLLAELRNAGLIAAWHAFTATDGSVACHIRLTTEQADAWYCLLDNSSKTLLSTSELDLIPDEFKTAEGVVRHRFL